MLQRCRRFVPFSWVIKTSPFAQSYVACSTNTADSRPLSARVEEQSVTDSLRQKTAYVAEKVSDDDELVAELFNGVKDGNRAALARSITLIENMKPEKQAKAQHLLSKVMELSRQRVKHSVNRVPSFRIGLTGPPGAGKSTFIEAMGSHLTSLQHKVAVLAVDPSSVTSGGSILADKTRMPDLSVDPNAYIRPSPSCGNLGGVARFTNDAILLCEGCGYDIVLVETVGVGQSEYAVADMVDMFVLIIPPAGGDELQAIKKGIVEMADLVVVNKADGDLLPAARRIRGEYMSALKYVRPKRKDWRPKVMKVSSLKREGIAELWETMSEFRSIMLKSGELEAVRERQQVVWMRNQIRANLLQLFQMHPGVRARIEKMENMVAKSAMTPGFAADILLQEFTKSLAQNSL